MNSYLTTTVGLSVLAGVTLIEAALLPAQVVGGAVVLAPKYLRKVRRKLQPAPGSTLPRRIEPPAAKSAQPDDEMSQSIPARFGVKQAVAKTITFRIIVTTLDFTANYVVIGELATAAGLSTLNLIGGPLFYLAHETAWNYLGPSGTQVDVPALSRRRTNETAPPEPQKGFTISRALAKTITFRSIATVIDFTTNYVVVGDVVTAVGLSAFGFVLGPFVYLGHEMAWDRFSSSKGRAPELSAPAQTCRR
jgi:uncharacterized membrane protein